MSHSHPRWVHGLVGVVLAVEPDCPACIAAAADEDPGELAEPAIHRASRNIPEHYAGAFLICARCRAEVGRV